MTAKHLPLHIHDDIEFMTPAEFDIPTPQDLERERQLAAAMDLWVEDYNERLEPSRQQWLADSYEHGWALS